MTKSVIFYGHVKMWRNYSNWDFLLKGTSKLNLSMNLVHNLLNINLCIELWILLVKLRTHSLLVDFHSILLLFCSKRLQYVADFYIFLQFFSEIWAGSSLTSLVMLQWWDGTNAVYCYHQSMKTDWITSY